ncbi:MAG: MEDS domain-containing protein [Acidobacteriaceae bacterium]
MCTNNILLGMGLQEDYLNLSDHVAYFWESDREFKKAVGFLEVGLRANDHCVIFGYQDANDRVLQVLRELGFEPRQLMESGRLSVLMASATCDETLADIGATFQKAIADGAPLIRLLGNIGWNRPKWPEEEDLLAFESRVTDAARQFPCVVICMYDIRALAGQVVIRGGLECHPVTIRGNVTRINPHYVAVEEFLESQRKRIS